MRRRVTINMATPHACMNALCMLLLGAVGVDGDSMHASLPRSVVDAEGVAEVSAWKDNLSSARGRREEGASTSSGVIVLTVSTSIDPLASTVDTAVVSSSSPFSPTTIGATTTTTSTPAATTSAVIATPVNIAILPATSQPLTTTVFLGCSTHSACPSGKYCDVFRNCYTCDYCFNVFNDAIDG